MTVDEESISRTDNSTILKTRRSGFFNYPKSKVWFPLNLNYIIRFLWFGETDWKLCRRLLTTVKVLTRPRPEDWFSLVTLSCSVLVSWLTVTDHSHCWCQAQVSLVQHVSRLVATCDNLSLTITHVQHQYTTTYNVSQPVNTELGKNCSKITTSSVGVLSGGMNC